MANFCKHTGKQVLLVEGKNDCHVILAFCKEFNLPELFGIYDCESDFAVLKRLNALILQPDGPETIGVVIDANSSGVMRRWENLQTKIRDSEYNFPKNPYHEGTILPKNPGKPRLGIWIMPNNQEPGMLEDFLLGMADQDTLAAASECIESAKSKGVTNFKEIHYSKALIHTYLSWQDEPGKPLGQSVTSHVLQPHTKLSHIFTSWLQRLFILD